MERVLISDLTEHQNELYHYGVLGMKWGIRRYQPYSLIPRKSGEGGKEIGTAKKASKSDGLKSTISKLQTKKKGTPISEVKKSRKQKQGEVKSQRISDEKTARERKLKAAEVVKSGDAKLIYQNRADLTDKQLQDAINRIGTEARLKDLVAYQNPSKMQQLAKTADKLKTAVNMAETGIQTYNQVARVANAFLGENENGNRNNVLPYIGNAQNSYKKEGGISAQNRDFITSATKVSDLMNAAGKFNAAEAKLAQDKAMSLDKLRQLSQAEKKNAEDMRQRAIADSKKAAENQKKELASRQEYLKTTMSEITAGKERADAWTDGGMKPSPILETKRDTRTTKDLIKADSELFKPESVTETKRELRSSKDLMKADSELFKPSSEKNEAFDDYFENEVKKKNKNKK